MPRVSPSVAAVASVVAAYAAVGALAVVSAQAPATPTAAGTLQVTYIANQGVLLAAGDTQVLIDGLHRPYQPIYPSLPEREREQIETARPPFDGIDLILVSHVHRDHFHPEAVARHLRHNPKAVLVSSEQVVREIQALGNVADISPLMTAITPALRTRQTTEAAGMTVDILGVGHGTGRHATVQNLGHLITLGGTRVLHIGDATTEDPGILEAFDLDEAGIDVAFLPVWFLTGEAGAAIVRQHIKPRHIVAIHMPADDPQRAVTRIRQRFPDAVAFTSLLETKVF